MRKDAPLHLLGPLGCRVQTGVGAILNVLKPTPASKLVIFGVGSVGLSAVMAAGLTPCETIIVVDGDPDRLKLAKELGATHAMEAGEHTEKHLLEMLGAGADCVFDTTGVPEVIYLGLNIVAPRGAFGYVTSPWDGSDMPFPVRRMLWGRRIVGIIQGSSQPQTFIPALVNLILAGRLPIGRIARFYDFNDISLALKDREAGRTIKPILRFDT